MDEMGNPTAGRAMSGTREARIVLAFAATGKSFAARRRPDRVLDMVAMPYKYHLPEGPLAQGEAEASKGAYASDPSAWNEEWPHNYVEAVEREADSGKWDYVLCPSDPFVLSSLVADGREVHVVIPEAGLKDEYRRRFVDRGSVALVEHLIDNGAWERGLGAMKEMCGLYVEQGRPVRLLELPSGRFLMQVM